MGYLRDLDCDLVFLDRLPEELEPGDLLAYDKES